MAFRSSYNQVYTRTEHIRLFGKLPKEALKGIRYYETASLQYDFITYPPLQGGGVKGKSMCFVVVTDWSLFFVSMDSKYDQAVLLELPLLGIANIDMKTGDCAELLNNVDAFKATLMSITPKVDISKLPQAMRDELDIAVCTVNSGADAVAGIPLSARFFGSSHLPRALPPPQAPTYSKPYTGRAPAPAPVKALWDQAPVLPTAQAVGGTGAAQTSQSQHWQQHLKQGRVSQATVPPAGPQTSQTPGQQHYTQGPGQQHYTQAPGQQHYTQTPGQQHYTQAPGQQHYKQTPGQQHYTQTPGQQHYTQTPGQQHQQQQPHTSSSRIWAGAAQAGQAGHLRGAGTASTARPLGEAVEQAPVPQQSYRPLAAMEPKQQLRYAEDPFLAVRSESGSGAVAASGYGAAPSSLQAQQQSWSQWQQKVSPSQQQQGQQQQTKQGLPTPLSPGKHGQLQQQGQQQLQWLPVQQQQPGAGGPAHPHDALPSSWVGQQTVQWQQQQQRQLLQPQDGGPRVHPLQAQRDQHMQRNIIEAEQAHLLYPRGQHSGTVPPAQRYGSGTAGPSRNMSWVEEQSLAWQQKQAQMYGEQVAPTVQDMQYIVQHEVNTGGTRAQQFQASRSSQPQYNQQNDQHQPCGVEGQYQSQGPRAVYPSSQQLYEQQQLQQQQQPAQHPQRQASSFWDSVPMAHRQSFPPPVAQPAVHEVWRAEDDDIPEFTHQDMLEQVLPGYVMKLLTIEPKSALPFFIYRAWLGAHMRLGLVASGMPGIPLWYTPTPSPFLLHSNAKSMTRASPAITAEVALSGGRVSLDLPRDQPVKNMSMLAFFGHRIFVVPSQLQWHQSALARGACGLNRLFPSPYPALLPWPVYPMDHQLIHPEHQMQQQLQQQQKASRWGRVGAAVSEAAGSWVKPLVGLAIMQDGITKFQAQQMDQQEQQLLLTSGSSRFMPGGILQGGKSAAQIAAEAAAGTSAPDATSVWRHWESTGVLSSGCSLFDDEDVDLVREMTAEAVLSETSRSHALAGGLFRSKQATAFILQRLYAWSAVCAMYGTRPEAAAARPESSPYVQWVLSKSQRVRGVFAGYKHDDLVDMMTGKKRTVDEEAQDFFGALYQLSSWKQPAMSAPRPSDLLRRLCLVPDVHANLSRTVGTIIDTLNQLLNAEQMRQAAVSSSKYGLRSEPPEVPAPPTLAPEPLMLSPLDELPYLFALEAPEAAVNLLANSAIGQRPQRGKKKANRHQTAQGQESLQTTKMGRMLKSSYVESYLGRQAGDIVLERSRGVELWDRLVGRLAARLAWKKTSLLLCWLNSQLSFSDGSESRTEWLTTQIVQWNPNPNLDDWTYEDCTRHLMALCMQIKDPQGLPLSSQMRSQSRSDMVAWSRFEARQYSLDWQAGILYTLDGICQEADVLMATASKSMFREVLQRAPTQAILVLAQRLFLRLISLLTGEAALHGVCGVTAAKQPPAEPNGLPAVLAAEVSAYRVSNVLESLLRFVPGLAASLADQHYEDVLHLIRTPETRALLASRSCNVVLSRWTLYNLDVVLQQIRQADVPRRAKAGATALSVPQLVSRAALHAFRMPTLLT